MEELYRCSICGHYSYDSSINEWHFQFCRYRFDKTNETPLDYQQSYRWSSFTRQNGIADKYENRPIIGWEPYNNIDAILTGDNYRMMYYELREPVTKKERI